MIACADLTVRGRCFLAAGAAAIICGIQIGERDFVRIGLLAALRARCWPGCCSAVTEREVWVRRNVSALQVEAGETRPGRGRGGQLRHAAPASCCWRRSCPRHSGEPQRFVLEPWRRTRDHAALPDPRRDTGAATRSGRCTCASATRSAWSTSTRRCRPTATHPGHPAHRAAAPDRAHRPLGRRRRQPHPRPARRRQPRRHDPRVPPRRRPAPDPLADAAPASTS